jgi:hypothetical protein
MQYVRKIGEYFSKAKEYLVSGPQSWYTQPWYTVPNRGEYRTGWEQEIKQIRAMKQYTGGVWPPTPNLCGPEVQLPNELREKMSVARQSSKAQTEKNYKHPPYCVCPTCNKDRKECMIDNRNIVNDPRYYGVDLSSDYYGAGSKITKFTPYYGTPGIATMYPSIIQVKKK